MDPVPMEDLWTEEIYREKYVQQKPSIHVLRSRARMFEDSDDESFPRNEPDKPPMRMIRGRPLKVHKKDVRPGIDNLSDITRQIRQVNDWGFTNNSAESWIASGGGSVLNTNYSLKFEDADMPDLSFRTVRTKVKKAEQSRSSSSEESDASTVKNDSDNSSYYSA